jgi:hypothetical protein
MDETDRITWMMEDGNSEGLLRELRCQERSAHRLQAARALLQLHQVDFTSWLLNAVLYDPDELVRRGVKTLLQENLGGDIEMALKVEKADGIPLADPWLIDAHNMEDDEFMNESNYEQIEGWDMPADPDGLLFGLQVLLRNEKDPALRIKAVRKMASLNSVTINDTLADIVLKDEDSKVRQVAHEVLENRLGDGTESFLNALKAEEGYEEPAVLLTDYSQTSDYRSPTETGARKKPEGMPKSVWLVFLVTVVIIVILIIAAKFL